MNESTTRCPLKSSVPDGLSPKNTRVSRLTVKRHTATLSEVPGFSKEQGYITSIAVAEERSEASP